MDFRQRVMEKISVTRCFLEEMYEIFTGWKLDETR